MRSCLCVVAALALFAGCGPQLIQPSNPDPNLDLPHVEASIGLKIGDEVADTVPAFVRNGRAGVEILRFRSTLTNAFLNAFEDVFTSTHKNGGDYVIELVAAKPDFIKATVTAEGGTVAVRAMVEYQARLWVGDEIVARTSGRAVAPDAVTTFGSDGSANVGAAVSVMYERMFVELINQYAESVDEKDAPAVSEPKASEEAPPAGQAFCCEAVDGRAGTGCAAVESAELAACINAGKSALSCATFSGNAERIECAE